MLVLALSTVVLLTGVVCFWPQLWTVAQFCWSCFVNPIGKTSDQQAALERFYQSQAAIYDKTRQALLKGRETMLRLAISHLRSKRNLVWVDLGGGTGYNIEYMNSIFPLSNFKAVYLVDLSPSLCKIAEERVRSLGVKNVYVHCRDVNQFSLPPNEKAHLVTLSYSLSMIPNYHSTIDKVSSMLDSDGVAGVVDFYVQSESSYSSKVTTLGGELFRHVNWLSRNFWRLWFEFDRVHLDPARRDYLEYRFGTVKSLNCRNKLLGAIPYYVWLGCDKKNAADINYRHQLAIESPVLAPMQPVNDSLPLVQSKGYDAAMVSLEQNLPYPSFYYQREIWRIFYDGTHPKHHQFNEQYIYAFTWEDPIEDNNILKFNSEDVVLAITSACDNVLAYAALDSPPKRIHAVDMNPHQNHLAELKLAAIKALPFEDVWKMFGEGKIADFEAILIDKLSVHMSSPALQYWEREGPRAFTGKGLYDTGSTRWALRLARWVFAAYGVTGEIQKFCEARTMEEQIKIWETKLRPALLNKYSSRLMFGNSVFLWKALGVPMNQADLIEGGIFQYIVDTLEPVVYTYKMSNDNYFYYLCLMGHYSPKNCPAYLTKKGYFNMNRRKSALDGIRLHTDSINDVVERLVPGTVTIAIVMDHMDWFSPTGTDAEEEILQLYKALTPGGRVMLRSSSTKPWYLGVFEKNGFTCEPAAVRTTGKAIDRVNMYASTWVCTKDKMQELTI